MVGLNGIQSCFVKLSLILHRISRGEYLSQKAKAFPFQKKKLFPKPKRKMKHLFTKVSYNFLGWIFNHHSKKEDQNSVGSLYYCSWFFWKALRVALISTFDNMKNSIGLYAPKILIWYSIKWFCKCRLEYRIRDNEGRAYYIFKNYLLRPHIVA